MQTVEIYTKSYCPYCVKAKNLLDKKQVKYLEIDVEHDEVRRQEMFDRSEGRRTVPQIFIGGKGIGGCDNLYDLESKGTLDSLLQGGE